MKFVLRLLKNAESNADAKNLELEDLYIKNIVVQQAPVCRSCRFPTILGSNEWRVSFVFRKPAAARTVHTVVSTPTRVTRATLRSSSPHLTPRSSGPRTRMSLLPHHSPASTGGRLPADVLRLLVLLPREYVLLSAVLWVMRVCGWWGHAVCLRRWAGVVVFICMRMPCR